MNTPNPPPDALMSHARRRTEHLLIQQTGEDLVVFDQQRHVSHALNRTAALIFQHADGTRSVADLVALLKTELNETADEDLVVMTLAKLHRAHLLEETAQDRSAEALRASRRRFVRKIGLVGSLTLLLPAVETIVAPRSAMAQSGPSCDSDSDSGCSSSCDTACDTSSASNSASSCATSCSSGCNTSCATGCTSVGGCASSTSCACACSSTCDTSCASTCSCLSASDTASGCDSSCSCDFCASA